MRWYVRRRRAALTLIELLVVMMILVILASSVTLYVVNKTEQARVGRAKSDIAALELALDSYRVTVGEYPTSEQGLQALSAPPDGVDEAVWKQGGPFIKKPNYNDPWGNEYVYVSPGADERDYDITCYGADGKEGGENKDADISSWDLGATPAQ